MLRQGNFLDCEINSKFIAHIQNILYMMICRYNALLHYDTVH